jgi:Flp pilus assembly protein TadD
MALIAAVLTAVGPAPGPAPAPTPTPTPPAVTRIAAAAAPAATVIPVSDRPALVALAPVAPAQQLPSRVPPRPLAVAQALLRAGKTDEACARLLQARPDADRSAAVYRLLGKCYMRRGRIAEAKAHYRRYLELAPGADDAPFVRGILNR